MTAEKSRLRWWQVLGPWPLQPLGAGAATWMFTVSFTLGRLAMEVEHTTVLSVLQFVVLAPIPGICAFVAFWLMRRYWPGCATNGWKYAGAMFVGGLVIHYSRVWIGLAPVAGLVAGPGTFIGGMLRSVTLLVVIHAVMGVAGRRLEIVADQRRVAMELAQEQQELLLGADERIRVQVSSLLHDRVQAGLVAACLELRVASADLDARVDGPIRQVIDRLERMRTVDVRPAARALSPDLVDSDIYVALEELAAQYAPAMLVTLDIDETLVRIDTRPGATVLLACYRIVEQALLNSAVHGRAQRCRVTITASEKVIAIEVEDNGIGLPLNPPSGVGTALTTTRMRMLNGTWSRMNRPEGGVRLTARIPV